MGWRDFQNAVQVDLTDKTDFIPPSATFNQLNPFNPPRDGSDKPTVVGPNTDPATATEPFNQHHIDAIKGGQSITVWSETLSEFLVWVRDEQIKRQLRSQGCDLTIYTLGELAVVCSMPVKDTKPIHEIKKAFDGTVQ